MKVILLENLKKIGSIGEVIDVNRGFARNYLIANKKALYASKENIKEVEKIKSNLTKKDNEKKQEAIKIFEKVNLAKPNTKVTTPITSAINALKSLKIKRLSIFTPYTDEINQSVINYFKKENIEIDELSYFNIASDLDIGKVNPDHLFDVLSKIDLLNSDALFVSCTALPVLSIIKNLEKKMSKIVLSSNQTLIWDTLKQIDFKSKVEGYGELFNN